MATGGRGGRGGRVQKSREQLDKDLVDAQPRTADTLNQDLDQYMTATAAQDAAAAMDA